MRRGIISWTTFWSLATYNRTSQPRSLERRRMDAENTRNITYHRICTRARALVCMCAARARKETRRKRGAAHWRLGEATGRCSRWFAAMQRGERNWMRSSCNPWEERRRQGAAGETETFIFPLFVPFSCRVSARTRDEPFLEFPASRLKSRVSARTRCTRDT